jgi:heme exporter protein D
MQFENWQAFWQMGGYAFFVWLSFGLSFLLLVWLVIDSAMAQRRLFTQVEKEMARQQRIKKSRKVNANETLQSTNDQANSENDNL